MFGRIAFTDGTDEVILNRGERERLHLSILRYCTQKAGVSDDDLEAWKVPNCPPMAPFPDGHSLSGVDIDWFNRNKTHLFLPSFTDELTLPWGHRLSLHDLRANTAIQSGDPVLQLCVRLHYQCEINVYVEAKSRKWLANVIRQGLDRGVFVPFFDNEDDPKGHSQWWGVIDLLEARTDQPVVSYWTGFWRGVPNQLVAEVADDEAWERLSCDEKWKLFVQGLRKARRTSPLSPDNLGRHFGERQYTFDDLFQEFRSRFG